MNTTTAG